MKKWEQPVFHSTPFRLTFMLMTSPELVGDAADTGAAQAPEFRITILFESEKVGRRAAQACHRLLTKFGDSFKYRIAVANFAALEAPAQFQQSLEFSRGADMLFVVSDAPLPATSKRWLMECIEEHADAPYALADMTREGLSCALGIKDTLHLSGRRYTADVIRQRESVPRTAVHVTAAVAYTPSTEIRHWGINE
jgi:hypothetical protein